MGHTRKALDNAYIYGKSPNPTTWHEAADVLRKGNKKKSSGLGKHLEEIKQLLKDKK
jgi:primase-polymerase (primpol)-like protein